MLMYNGNNRDALLAKYQIVNLEMNISVGFGESEARGAKMFVIKNSLCLGVEPSFRADNLRLTGACTNRYTNRDVAIQIRRT